MGQNGPLSRNVTKCDGGPSDELRDAVRGPLWPTEGRISLIQVVMRMHAGHDVRPFPRCEASRCTAFLNLDQINSGQMVPIKKDML
jgi:hypothetical protein